MGCGASKNTIEADVLPTTLPKQNPQPSPTNAKPTVASPVNAAVPVEAPVVNSVQVEAPVQQQAVPVEVRDTTEEFSSKPKTLNKAVMPSIPSETPAPSVVIEKVHKPIAFEIPLDEDLKAAAVVRNMESKLKNALPKLAIDNKEMMAKLANSEARWKDLEAQSDKKSRKKRVKPELSNKNNLTSDPILLKKRLLEKEAQAAKNRLREIEKLQSKLAKQEEHARQVLERKRAMGRMSNEDLSLSWGGEESGLEIVEAAANKLLGVKEMKDTDSGKGSSMGGSRTGSGRSTGAVDITGEATNLILA
ncbi:hypothetical protein HDV05_000225 [Chytridiales sp. JEL 0842]|nr:hypothetical protein HDV05_000225 [Chytridiales sp. JEL 0842]